jgi:Protein of unknown function (DUF2865)
MVRGGLFGSDGRALVYGKAASIGIRLIIPPLLAALASAASNPALADRCSSLHAQLAALSRQGAVSSRAGSARELATLQTQAKWGGCISAGHGFFVAKRSPECPRILERLAELQGGGVRRPARGNSLNRARILGALKRNGCSASMSRQAGEAGGIPNYGAYRTVCVRTCDGYYFPIGYSTRRSLLKVEEAACKSMYFGNDAALYVYRTNGDVEDARSLTGERYADKPYAFVFRDVFKASCVAQIREGLAGLAKVLPPPKIAVRVQRAPGDDGGRVVDASIPLPAERPPRAAEDPETRMNDTGDFAVQAEDRSERVADATIRRIGPAYYYEPRPDPARFVRTFIDEPVPYTFQLIDAARADEQSPTERMN